MNDTRTVPVELLQQALEALESLFTLQVDYARPKQCGDAITAIKAALEQPEQEPVAWVNHGENRITRATGWDGYGALYTHPPRREWRGLSVDEIDRIAKQEWGEDHEIFWFDDDGIALFARALETALKEKNT
jgi:hypothetical protein